jgi:hypothetical protein
MLFFVHSQVTRITVLQIGSQRHHLSWFSRKWSALLIVELR